MKEKVSVEWGEGRETLKRKEKRKRETGTLFRNISWRENTESKRDREREGHKSERRIA